MTVFCLIEGWFKAEQRNKYLRKRLGKQLFSDGTTVEGSEAKEAKGKLKCLKVQRGEVTTGCTEFLNVFGCMPSTQYDAGIGFVGGFGVRKAVNENTSFQ